MRAPRALRFGGVRGFGGLWRGWGDWVGWPLNMITTSVPFLYSRNIMAVIAIGAIWPAMGEGCGGCGKGLRDWRVSRWLGLGWKILTRNLLFLTGFRFLGIFSDLVVNSRPNQIDR